MVKVLYKALCAFFIVLYTGTEALAQQDTKAAAAGRAFERMLNDEAFAHAASGLCILDGATGSVLYAKNEQLGLAPASTLKTITTAAALYRLGLNYTYKTRLAYTGKIVQGVLQGDLVIDGSGDPMLGSSRVPESSAETVLNGWTTAVQALGIRQIQGRVVGYDLAFGTQTTPNDWPYQEIGNYYGAGASGLNWAENQFDVLLNSRGQIRGTQPDMPYLKLVNELRGGRPGSGDNAYAYLMPYDTVAYLRGTWAPDVNKDRIALSLPDPAYDCALRLNNRLQAAGISSNGATTQRRMLLAGQSAGKQQVTVSEYASPGMPVLLRWFMTKSINLYGEALLRRMDKDAGGDGSTESAVKEMKRFWQGKGISPAELNIFDGSGLSPANRVTPLAMARILYMAAQEPWAAAYMATFPLYNGMTIKSGTITNVHGYAGYYRSSNGKLYVVVINSNNYSGGSITPKLFKVLDELK